jgi:hypothetical protein
LNIVQIVHAQTNETSKTPVGTFESKDLSVSNLRTGEVHDRIVIAGTIKNIIDEPITGISFSAQIYNSTDAFVGLMVMSGPDLPLEPGQEYSFEIPTSNTPNEVDHYTVSVSSDR